MKNTSSICFILLMSVLSVTMMAQEAPADSTQAEAKTTKFTVMPFLSYNRNLKFMFGVIPMAMYKLNKKDMVSPRSLSGVALVYTTNDSYFISVFNRFFLAEDKWRITMYAVTGDNNSQFFADDGAGGDFYDYTTETAIVSAGFQRKVVDHVYLGLTYTYSNYYTEYEGNIQDPSTTITNGLEFTSLYDTRDAIYYPTTGIQAKLRWLTFQEWFGNDVEANKIKAIYNQYFSLRDSKDVVAGRFSGVFGLGDIAFEQQVTISGKDIRGYTQGKYRGDGQMAVQGEYRFNFHKRMGLVAFAGLSTIYGSGTESFDWKLYPGVGAGYRFKAFEEENFNIGLDAAVGKGDWGIYFRIGEAF